MKSAEIIPPTSVIFIDAEFGGGIFNWLISSLFGSRVCKFSELPFLSPDLLFGWIVSKSFSAVPQNHVIVPL